ncbi:MAG: hypothetical protein A8274_411 [Halanaerobium sp. 4-GBenrich]|jgi:hypothetical protein|nr:MAG: hypothetical protein A8274_411 [Halanaerobium sp. 4-GBenrich]PUU91261.1 MAG: hypothetical protein CI948_1231 [Halanaerobium sp.]
MKNNQLHILILLTLLLLGVTMLELGISLQDLLSF